MRRRDFIIHCDRSSLRRRRAAAREACDPSDGRAAPSLKYQLLPPFETRIRGNAAVYYGKVTAEHLAFFTSRELQEKIENWRNAPLADLRKKDVRVLVPRVEEMLARAARCESCDWQLPVHEEDYFTIWLPEVQQTRQFARILATSARIHIARGEFDAALMAFQSGFAMARNVSAGETLVNDLVAIAIDAIMVEQVREFEQQPAAPNLYWALAMLPRPVVDMRNAVEAERNGLASMLPAVRDLNAPRSPTEWRQLLERFWHKVAKLTEGTDQEIPSPDALVAACLRNYPQAKISLLNRGTPAETVEAMPAAQVVLVELLQTFEDDRDTLFQWMFVPYPAGAERMQAMQPTQDDKAIGQDPNTALRKLLLPAAWAAYQATARLERDFALLRVVEALRLYGASHNGCLPEKLDEMTEVPIPDDPVTGKPFVYRLDGATATIELTPLPARPTSWEITMER